MSPLPCAELHDLLPGILPQLGADNMNALRKLAEENYGQGAAGAFGRGPPGGVATIEEEDEDDGEEPRPDLSYPQHSICVHLFSVCGYLADWLDSCCKAIEGWYMIHEESLSHANQAIDHAFTRHSHIFSVLRRRNWTLQSSIVHTVYIIAALLHMEGDDCPLRCRCAGSGGEL